MTKAFLRVGQGICIVYDIGSAHSLESVLTWFELVHKSIDSPENIPIVIVGNKCDSAREVSWEDGKAVSERIGKMGVKVAFFEISAKTGVGVEPLFLHVVTAILTIRRPSALGSSRVNLGGASSQSSCFQADAARQQAEV
jgi:GTPase SAR1 family protein